MRPTKQSGEILKKYVELAEKLGKIPTLNQTEKVVSERQIKNHFGSFSALKELALKTHPFLNDLQAKPEQPKVLLFDIETAPIEAFVWGLWDNNVALNQIIADWSILSWSAKWLGTPENETMYQDVRASKNIRDDKSILQGIWDLLDEADVIITQNGRKFDVKKLNARFIFHGFQPPSSYKHIDTLALAKKYFGFTSNKLEYMTDKLCTKYKKLSHKKFPGQELWNECLKGNKEAWQEMEKYNRYDVLSLEELYTKLVSWDNSVNFNLYHDGEENICKCGSTEFIKKEFYYTQVSKFQRYRCKKCGAETRDNKNLLTSDKRKSLRRGTVR